MFLRRLVAISLLAVLSTAVLGTQQRSSDEEKVWSLEQNYWQYVKANDLAQYRALWHPRFIGWPSVSPEPLGKDHITDWITAHTGKGERLASYDLERLAVQVTGNLAVTHYRVRSTWADSSGKGEPVTTRICHTWLRNDSGGWEIIAGMSAPSNAQGH